MCEYFLIQENPQMHTLQVTDNDVTVKAYGDDTIDNWFPKSLLCHQLEVGEHHSCNLLRSEHLLSVTVPYLGVAVSNIA